METKPCDFNLIFSKSVVYSDPGGDDVLVRDLLHLFSTLKFTFILRPSWKEDELIELCCA
jgi:hypothetical protein